MLNGNLGLVFYFYLCVWTIAGSNCLPFKFLCIQSNGLLLLSFFLGLSIVSHLYQFHNLMYRCVVLVFLHGELHVDGVLCFCCILHPVSIAMQPQSVQLFEELTLYIGGIYFLLVFLLVSQCI